MARLPRSGVPPLLIVVVALILVAGLAIWFVSHPSDEANDRTLADLYQRGQFGAVSAFYEANKGKFEDEANAALIAGQAELKKATRTPAPPSPNRTSRSAVEDAHAAPSPPAPIEIDPGGEDELEIPEGDGDGVEVVEETEEETADLEEESSTPGTPEQKKRRPQRARRDKNKAQERARKLFNDGKRALLTGDLSKAEENLTRCVAVMPRYAQCHRGLGVLYAQKDDTQRSVKHYRMYVQLAPNAGDAQRVREYIRNAAGGDGSE